MAIAAVVIAAGAFVFSLWSFREQRKQDERNVRRDVLRRLVGNLNNLLVEGQEGTRDEEPYIALNEAWVVYAGFPRVIDALEHLHREYSVYDNITDLPQNLERLLSKRWQRQQRFLSKHIDRRLIEYPFTAPIR